MKEEFLKKSWIVSLTVLFIVGGLTSNIGADDIGTPIMGKTWFIDDDATYPGDGSIDKPFRYIWQGIENATSGDALSISSGEYIECIIIEKQLILKSNDTGKPTINGNYKSNVIEIHATGVEITDMEIIAGRSTGNNAGVYIEEGAKNVKIERCVISDCYFGIWSQRTKADEVFHIYRENEIYNIVDIGILASGSDEVIILGNTITDCGYCGILLLDCEQCVIMENVCENNEHGIGIDIGRKNDVSYNTCKGNTKWGFYIVNGLGNTIKSNNFMDNGREGQATWVETRFIGSNQWTNNYWGGKGLIIHIIGGSVRRGDVDIPWFRIGLFPSSSEY